MTLQALTDTYSHWLTTHGFKWGQESYDKFFIDNPALLDDHPPMMVESLESYLPTVSITQDSKPLLAHLMEGLAKHS